MSIRTVREAELRRLFREAAESTLENHPTGLPGAAHIVERIMRRFDARLAAAGSVVDPGPSDEVRLKTVRGGPGTGPLAEPAPRRPRLGR